MQQQLVEYEADEQQSIVKLKQQIKDQLVRDRNCVFCKHAGLIVKKRSKIYKRSLRTCMLEILIPLALVLSGFSMSKIQLLYHSEPFELSPNNFGDSSERIILNENVINPASDAMLQERDEFITVDESILFARQQGWDLPGTRRNLQSSIFNFRHNEHEDEKE